MKHRNLIALTLLALWTTPLLAQPAPTQAQSPARAGNEGRGTEDDVAVGIALVENLTPEQREKFEKRQQEIRQLIESGAARTFLSTFVTQVRPAAIQNLKFAEAHAELLRLGLAEDIARTRIYVASRCEENGVERTASTQARPFADICVNPYRVAALELLPIFPNVKEGKNGVVYGILYHELARHYDKDQNHVLLNAFAKELSRQRIFDTATACPPGSTLCQSWFKEPGSPTGWFEVRDDAVFYLDPRLATRFTLSIQFLNGKNPKPSCFKKLSVRYDAGAPGLTLNSTSDLPPTQLDPATWTARYEVDTAQLPQLLRGKINIGSPTIMTPLELPGPVQFFWADYNGTSTKCGDAMARIHDSTGRLIHEESLVFRVPGDRFAYPHTVRFMIATAELLTAPGR
jgi:hypothetical protein